MANAQNFNKHIIVDFEKLVSGGSREINRLQNQFEMNGCCFIQLSDQKCELGDKLDEVQRTLSTFFIRNQIEKLQYK